MKTEKKKTFLNRSKENQKIISSQIVWTEITDRFCLISNRLQIYLESIVSRFRIDYKSIQNRLQIYLESVVSPTVVFEKITSRARIDHKSILNRLPVVFE